MKRQATISRKTKETEITATVDLDGSGVFDVETGIGFLDHMLEQLARHSMIDITLKAKGDLHIDFHHTAEDTGIVLGQAVAKALGDKKGITRYADVHLPMDDTLTRVAVDVSGRPYLVWKVEFSKPKVGEMDTELFREWFQAFAQNAGITLHVENLYGENNHHIAETCYKGLARALRRPRRGRCAPGRPRAVDQGHARRLIRHFGCEDRRWSSSPCMSRRTCRPIASSSAEQLVFVKDGFSWLAALVPPLWLLWKRMWLEFAIYAGATGLLVWALTSAGATNIGNAHR